MSDESSADGGSSVDADMYNEMLRLEEMESFLEEIEELEAGDATDLPAELRIRLASLNFANSRELRRRVELLHTSLDMAEQKRLFRFP
ncbi:MAG: hypothetical protein ABIO92_08405 [Chloroflexia bacterium]